MVPHVLSIPCIVSSTHFSLSLYSPPHAPSCTGPHTLYASPHSVSLPANVEMPGASAQSSSVYPLRFTSSALAASVGAPLLSPSLLSVLPSILHTSFSPSILKTLTNGLPVLQSSSCFLEELYQRPLTCPYRLYLTLIHPVHTHTHTHTHTCMHACMCVCVCACV